MCGIVGMIARQQSGFGHVHRDIFTEMLIADQLRGEDSTGVYGCTVNGPPDMVKAPMHSTEFVSTKAYARFYNEMFQTYRMVVGHNRKATKGSITGANAHPFSEGKITLVHNGTIRNQKDLNTEVEVDSHAITHALNDNDAPKALESIDGAFALVWYDSEARTLNLARNKERPLYIAEFADAWIFASEPGMIFWISGRNSMKAIKYTEVPVGQILTFSMDERNKYETVAYKDWVYKAPEVKYFPKSPAAPSSALPTVTDKETRTMSAAVTSIFEKSKTTHIPKLLTTPKPSMCVGAKLTVKWVDSKDLDANDHRKGCTLIGHPIYEDEGIMDENICVNWWVPKFTDGMLNTYFSEDLFSATITGYTISSGVPTFTVREPEKLEIKTSQNGWPIDRKTFDAATSHGCLSCATVHFNFDEVPGMFMKPRKDKSWRVYCADCWSGRTAQEQKKATVH